ncbi:hypothetical protein SPBR_01076 [Sporothrix brasiliensis 5110]|uniref:Uncharacterized protein n=1 Tax=Sporothrix brasiliensis 5110 TaxID=1398154 RepID=A0A0C2FIB9_9PEZI|nr:uncharacterized protein SPBR_01076 [Sporothrix brasiliensis 5110]KIH90798.1 hypothetical protein SPBR_01076 [Sporothrix brasiliensis 5110]
MVVPDLFHDGTGVALIADDAVLPPVLRHGAQQTVSQAATAQQPWQAPLNGTHEQRVAAAMLATLARRRMPNLNVLRWAIDQQQYIRAYSPVVAVKQEDDASHCAAANTNAGADADADADAEAETDPDFKVDGESDPIDLVDDGRGGTGNSATTAAGRVKTEDCGQG